jgi:hypothetical protein
MVTVMGSMKVMGTVTERAKEKVKVTVGGCKCGETNKQQQHSMWRH